MNVETIAEAELQAAVTGLYRERLYVRVCFVDPSIVLFGNSVVCT